MALIRRTASQFTIALLLMAGLVACAMDRGQTASGAPLARQVTAAAQCGFAEPGLVYLDSRARLDALTRKPGMNLPAIGDHDFSEESMLLVAIGQKPSGGYGVALTGSAIRDGTLEIAVEVRTPAPDQAVSMALTSPCALLAVTAEGWRRVRVSGPGLAELSLQR